MANAGCINAYDCNGCLIQTLQNLDSACIGVGVQYTAPNPLDDKRLDYIKYTDKCGCVQCLSAENEILIYATNGVIKNLTLTNDDVNEKVVVKWNDLFGSNWKKTVVRYKTGGYPTSITDGTLAVEELIMNQYSSTGYSVSGLSDSTTYYFSVFAVDLDDTIIDVQSSQITTDFIFAKYQKVEYIQSSGTQYIDTLLKANQNTVVDAKWSLTQYNGNYDKIYGSYGENDDNVFFMQSNRPVNNRFRITNYSNHDENRVYVDSSANLVLGQIYETKHTNTEFYVDGTLQGTCATTSYTSGYSVTIFGLHYGSNTVVQNAYMKLYYFKMYDGNTLMRNFVPCYRKSDNVIGMLDIVHKVFYTNSGSGSFTKGPNI